LFVVLLGERSGMNTVMDDKKHKKETFDHKTHKEHLKDAGIDIMLLHQLVEESSTSVYVADYETDELLYINHAAELVMGVRGEDVSGETCYEFLMHREMPCPFCHKCNMSEDSFLDATMKFPLDGRYYRIRSKITWWNQRKVHIHYITDVTKLMEQQQKLLISRTALDDALQKAKESQQKLRNVVEHVPGAMVVFYVKDKMLYPRYISEGCEKISGFTAEETYERNRLDPIADAHPDDRDMFLKQEWDDIQRKTKMSYTYRILCKNGSYKWVNLSLSPVVTNEELLYYGVLKDIDDEHEKAIMQENLVNALPGGVAIYKMGKPVETLYFSAGLRNLTGHTEEEYQACVKNDPIESLVFIEDREEMKKNLYDSVETGQPVNMTYRLYHKDGSLVWIQLSATKIREEEEIPLYYAIYTKPTEEAVQFKEIADDSAHGTLVLNRNTYRILYMNKACAKMIHVDNPGLVIGRDIDEYVSEDEKLLEREDISRLSADKYAEFHRVYGESRHIQLKGKNISWCGVDAFIIYITDETSRKEKENRYIRQVAAMTEADETNLLGKGRHNLSHNRTIYFKKKSDKALTIKENSSYDDAVEELISTAVSSADALKIRTQLDRTTLLRDYAEARKNGSLEYVRRQENGRPFWTQLRYVLLEEPGTGDIGIFVYTYDISERVLETRIIDRISDMEYDVLGVIDVSTHTFTRKRVQGKLEDSHTAEEGDFDKAARERIQNLVSPAERERLFQQLRVENIIEQLKKYKEYFFTYSIVDEGVYRRKRYQFCYLDDLKTTILYCRSDITETYNREQEQLQQT